jgi:hypothetical protein
VSSREVSICPLRRWTPNSRFASAKPAAFVVCRVCNLHHVGTPEALHKTLVDRNRLVFTCMFSHLLNWAFMPKDWWAETVCSGLICFNSKPVVVGGRRNEESGVRIPHEASHIHVFLFSAVLFSVPNEHNLLQLIDSRKTNTYGYEINPVLWEYLYTRFQDKLWTLGRKLTSDFPVICLVLFFKIIS